MSSSDCKFRIGQVIHHLKFGYRGVIANADPTFQGTEEWYDTVAKSKPPKESPWYQVLVHNSGSETYVAERHLELDTTGERINHPFLPVFFDEFKNGRYVLTRPLN